MIGLVGATGLYAESSAVLSWLFGESRGGEALRHLESATLVSTSELTLVECARTIHRDAHLGVIDAARATGLRARLDETTQSWTVIRMAPDIVARASQPFPNEPIRALDALHVASALIVRVTVPSLAILSFDDRIRRVGASLGFEILPT